MVSGSGARPRRLGGKCPRIGDGDPPHPRNTGCPRAVRHKVLDLIGDLATLGRLSGRVIAHRAGHRMHLNWSDGCGSLLLH